MAATSIEWTDQTWNPISGCTKVSPGCDRCFAASIAGRFAGTKAYPNGFEMTLWPERLDQPFRWRKPRRVFVNSMSDLFHDAVPDEFIARVWAVMSLASRHTFQVLTKRHARMRSLLNSESFKDAVLVAMMVLAADRGIEWPPAHGLVWPRPNIWLGVSTENQKWANIRIPALLGTPAAVRFISAEPLLGPINLGKWVGRGAFAARAQDARTETWADRLAKASLHAAAAKFDRPTLDWVIVGGESGAGARAMHPDWVRSLRDQCVAADVAFLMKQWGEWGPAVWKLDRLPDEDDEQYKARCAAEAATHSFAPWAHDYDMPPQEAHPAWGLERGPDCAPHAGLRQWGKKAAGRELDGRTWDEYPTHAAG